MVYGVRGKKKLEIPVVINELICLLLAGLRSLRTHFTRTIYNVLSR